MVRVRNVLVWCYRVAMIRTNNNRCHVESNNISLHGVMVAQALDMFVDFGDPSIADGGSLITDAENLG
jgi:hypothetical protein